MTATPKLINEQVEWLKKKFPLETKWLLQEQARQRKETIKKIIESPNHDEFETLNAISYEIEKWG